MSTRPAPPGGQPAPTTVNLAGQRLDLVSLARETCERYQLEFPDERGRYGPAGMQWCQHDNQHVLNWAALSLRELVDFEQQLAWLARVLESRAFPLERLVRSLELLSETVRRTQPPQVELADRIDAGASFVASRQSFLE